ncbi:MAG: acyl carrier protein [Bacteroidota bacterium]
MRTKLAEESGLKIEEISPDESFEEMNLDSLALVSLAYDLEQVTEMEINPTAFTEYDTINKLTEWIRSQK